MNYSFNLKAFESLPNSLQPSAYVDLLLLLGKEKKSCRFSLNQETVCYEMIQWCKINHLSYFLSKTGFMYISTHFFLAWLVKIIDDTKTKHEFLLGKILGYPTCCSRKIASIGESEIDEYEKKLIQHTFFYKPYHIINPEGYLKGYALISHIPCCSTCDKSLKKALKIFRIIEKYKEHPSFYRWTNQWFHNP